MGLPSTESRLYGVGFAVEKLLVFQPEDSTIGVSERLMKMGLPITQGRQATIFSCYGAILGDTDEAKGSFYDLPDNIIPLGHFNTRVGTDHVAW